jgi:hypothetical protein
MTCILSMGGTYQLGWMSFMCAWPGSRMNASPGLWGCRGWSWKSLMPSSI